MDEKETLSINNKILLADNKLVCGSYEAAENIYSEIYNMPNLPREISAKVLSRLYTVYFFKITDKSAYLKMFKSTYVKTKAQEDIFSDAIKFTAKDVNGLQKRIRNRLTPGFFTSIGVFSQYKLLFTQDLPIEDCDTILSMTEQCKEYVSKDIQNEIGEAAFKYIVAKCNVKEEAELRKIDEKKLRKEIAVIRKISRVEMENFEIDISFRFACSPFVNKQLDGMFYLNSIPSLTNRHYEAIANSNLMECLFKNMHRDLVKHYVTMLTRLWARGYFKPEDIKRFWALSIQQHSADATAFFDQWPRLFYCIPRENIGVFWDTIIETEEFPPESFSFLVAISSSCPAAIKPQIFEALWKSDTIRSKGILPLSKFAPQGSERLEIFNRCLDLINNPDNGDFAIRFIESLLPIEQNEYNRCLTKLLESQPTNKELFYRLLSKFILLGGDFINNEILDFLKSKITFESNVDSEFIISIIPKIHPTRLSDTIEWAASHKASSELVINLFKKANNITDIVTTVDIPGIDSLWTLLFEDNRTDIARFLSELYSKCEETSAIQKGIEKCATNLTSDGAMIFLALLIRTVEDHLDFEEIGISRNLFINQDSLLTIYLTGDITKTIKLPNGTNIITFKKICARLIGTTLSGVIILHEEKPVAANHILKSEQTFSVMRKSFAPRSQASINRDNLPSIILKKYYQNIFNILDNNENILLQQHALTVLNLMEPMVKDVDSFKVIPGQKIQFDRLLDVSSPMKLLHKLNYLGNLVQSANRGFLTACVTDGCLIKCFEIMNEASKSITRNEKKIENIPYLLMIVHIAHSLLYQCAQMDDQKIKETIKGEFTKCNIQEGIQSLSDWLILLINSHHPNIALQRCIASLLKAYADQDISKLEELPTLKELFKASFLNADQRVSAVCYQLFSILSSQTLVRLATNELDEAASKATPEFYQILKISASKIDDTSELFDKLSTILSKYLFQEKTNVSLRDDIEYSRNDQKEEKNEESEKVHISDDIETMELDEKLDIELPPPEAFQKFNEEEVQILKQGVLDVTSKTATSLFINGIVDTLTICFSNVKEITEEKALSLAAFMIKRIAFNPNRYLKTPGSLFSLLIFLSKRFPNVFELIVKSLICIISDIKDVHNIIFNPTLTDSVSQKGLKNLGMICYLNSSIQQIFRIKEIRDAVLSYASNSLIDSDCYSQLSLLFSDLLYSPFSFADPTGLVKTWKIWGKTPINPIEQMDACEFMQSVIDKVDDNVPGKASSNSVKMRILHVVSNEKLGFRSENYDTISNLSFEVQNCKNFEDSFKLFNTPDSISDYNTEGELGSIDVERSHYLDKISRVVIVQLKRFDFDMMSGDRKKINTYYKVPLVADFSPIMQNPTQDKYDLTGIVMHSGSAMSGHYFSYIKTNNVWLCFNDSMVYPLNTTPEHLVEHVAGGREEREVYDQTTRTVRLESVEKQTSAYILAYTRREDKEQPQETQDYEPISLLPRPMVKRLLDSNKDAIYKAVFTSDDFATFVTDIAVGCSYINKSSDQESLSDVLLFKTVLKMAAVSPYSDQYQRLHAVALSRAVEDRAFASYIITQWPQIVEAVRKNTDFNVRATVVSIVTAGVSLLKTDAIWFTDKIVEELPTMVRDWRFVDQLMQPVKEIVEAEGKKVSKYAESLMLFLHQMSEIYEQNKDEFQKFSNFTNIFSILTKLISEDVKLKNELEKEVISDEFMSLWFSTSENGFSVSTLIMTYVRDDQTRNQSYINYLSSQIDKISPQIAASHFATTITFDDSLQLNRIQWFFSFLRTKNWTPHQLSLFISETANKLRQTRPSYTILSSKKEWLEKWLINNDPSVRKSTIQLITALFPTYPEVRNGLTFTTSYDHRQTPSPLELNSFKVLFNGLIEIWNNMLSQSKSASGVLFGKLPTENGISATSFFELLAYVTYHGKLENRLKEASEKLKSTAKVLGNLAYEQKGPFITFLSFLYLFRKCRLYDYEVLASVVDAASNIPEKDEAQYVSQSAQKIIPLFEGSKRPEILTKRKYFEYCIFHCLFDDNAVCIPICNLIRKVNVQDLNKIASSIFTSDNYSRHVTNDQSNCFFDIVLFLIGACPEAVDLFFDNCLSDNVQFIHSAVSVSKSLRYPQKPLEMLVAFHDRYIKVKRGQKRFIFLDALGPLISFWEYKTGFIKDSIVKVMNSQTPPEFSHCLIDLITLIASLNDNIRTQTGKILAKTPDDVYSRVHPEVLPSYAKLVASVFRNENIKVVSEISKMCLSSVSDPEAVDALLSVLKNLPQELSPRLFVLLDRVFGVCDASFAGKYGKFAIGVASKCGKSQLTIQWALNIYPKILAVENSENEQVIKAAEFVKSILSQTGDDKVDLPKPPEDDNIVFNILRSCNANFN